MTRKSRSPWKVLPALASLIVAPLAAAGCAHDQPKPAPASARVVSVTPPARKAAAPVAAPPPIAAAPAPRDGEIYFDFDSSALRDDARAELQKLAGTAKEVRDPLVIEG